MTGLHFSKTNKEATKVSKKILAVAIIATLVLALGATSAFAEGYNSPQEYTRATGYLSGPHGGYTTTTNKCQDCHSTHYAAGSFMLLRANNREAACDYCHGGGGGSTVNIMMDNDYVNYSEGYYLDGAVEATTGAGYGTGHTLGYDGYAPVDINPAYTAADGFACFDCHSPHGNSARIMTTFANPGRHFAAPGQAGRPVSPVASGQWPVALGTGGMIHNAAQGQAAWTDDGLLQDGEWGIDRDFGNFVWDSNAAVGMTFFYRPIWPNGRFLLVKNPHKDVYELQSDTVVTTVGQTAGDVGFEGYNKFAIDWDEPLGPADGGYGGFQDNDNDKDRTGGYPFIANDGDSTTGGFSGLSDFCVDCHDGAAGASTQPAIVWQPAGTSGSGAGAAALAYSHDAQPRH